MGPSALASLLSLAVHAALCTVAVSPCHMYTQEFPYRTPFSAMFVNSAKPDFLVYMIFQAFS